MAFSQRHGFSRLYFFGQKSNSSIAGAKNRRFLTQDFGSQTYVRTDDEIYICWSVMVRTCSFWNRAIFVACAGSKCRCLFSTRKHTISYLLLKFGAVYLERPQRTSDLVVTRFPHQLFPGETIQRSLHHIGTVRFALRALNYIKMWVLTMIRGLVCRWITRQCCSYVDDVQCFTSKDLRSSPHRFFIQICPIAGRVHWSKELSSNTFFVFSTLTLRVSEMLFSEWLKLRVLDADSLTWSVKRPRSM